MKQGLAGRWRTDAEGPWILNGFTEKTPDGRELPCSDAAATVQQRQVQYQVPCAAVAMPVAPLARGSRSGWTKEGSLAEGA
ncbi:hypothetical protein G6O67_004582 [Ophiocordyceps sinensis]|uniref:Uncharacterized protein n=1 Tax=Ophiocordyceps sinensis TaxID=72228 RepID=A0A8H4PPT7_9HYPO|nr:hypothetical protein G6O67_004582 [Ophiocordyceps sinensis]